MLGYDSFSTEYKIAKSAVESMWMELLFHLCFCQDILRINRRKHRLIQ